MRRKWWKLIGGDDGLNEGERNSWKGVEEKKMKLVLLNGRKGPNWEVGRENIGWSEWRKCREKERRKHVAMLLFDSLMRCYMTYPSRFEQEKGVKEKCTIFSYLMGHKGTLKWIHHCSRHSHFFLPQT